MYALRRWMSVLLLTILTFTSSAMALELSPFQQEPYTGDLDKLKKKGVLRVLVAEDLGFYYVENGRPKGIIAEMIHHFEKSLKRYDKTIYIQVLPVARNELLDALQQGIGDIAIANLTVTPLRQKQVDFTNPILPDVTEVFVTNADHANITNIDQLSGKEVWVKASSSYFESLQQVNHQLNLMNKEPMAIRFVHDAIQDYDLFEMLEQGLIEATVLDQHKTKIWINAKKNIKVHKSLPLRKNGKVAWAIRKDSPILKREVNKFIKKSKSGTLLGNVIYGKYLSNTRWLNKAIDHSNLIRLDKLAHLFKKYAEEYDFDYLMLAAQAFQESGFNQTRVSHRGAVGVMQVLPSTAKDPYVNIPNIYTIENNVHAGVKYMRFIRDRYFSDDAISDDDKVYFSLASYNAGPAKIRRMRNRAKEAGYDPNQWFGHVEVIVRRYIGRETISYVSNINRYYVVYKQLESIKTVRNTTMSKLIESITQTQDDVAVTQAEP
ncbi:lytic transglycosylase F [Vibrio sp.]|nr:lytic transglycosylase F [Vibrio sp.]